MNFEFTGRAARDYADLPARIQRAVDKQLDFLCGDISHPSIRAKKYAEAGSDLWQGRVNRDYRFYSRSRVRRTGSSELFHTQNNPAFRRLQLVWSYAYALRYMPIPDDAIREYIELYREDFGEELSSDQAREIATRLVTLYQLVSKPLATENRGLPSEC